jgi:hypothetical protein
MDKHKPAVFAPLWNEINELRIHNIEQTFDYEDPAGNKLARSHVAKLRKVKTAITEKHKVAKEEALNVCKVLDAAKRDLIASVEEMIAVHQTPLDEIQKRLDDEANRIRLEQEEKERQRIAELEAGDAEAKRIIQEAADKDRADRLIAEGIEQGRRMEAQAKAQKEADEARRQADEKHRWAIQNDIQNDLMAAGLDAFSATIVFDEIGKGTIRHLKIQY